jgi:hypothetical protein
MGQKKYLTRANKQRTETLHLLVEKQPHYRKQNKIKHKNNTTFSPERFGDVQNSNGRLVEGTMHCNLIA